MSAKAQPMRSRVVKRAIAASPATIKHRRDARQFKAWTVSQLLEQYRDPRAILLEIAGTDTATLAKQMHGTLADALAERRLCAQAVLPYVAQKLPVQVDMRHTRAIHLNIVDERQYQELVEVAADEEQSDGTFSIALMPGNADEQGSADATQQAPQQQERAIQWDISPSNKGMQRKNVTSIDAVTPSTADAPKGRE